MILPIIRFGNIDWTRWNELEIYNGGTTPLSKNEISSWCAYYVDNKTSTINQALLYDQDGTSYNYNASYSVQNTLLFNRYFSSWAAIQTNSGSDRKRNYKSTTKSVCII